MRIAMIHLTGNGYPPDIRIAKEARALTGAGHEVVICTKVSRPGQAEEEQVGPGLSILRLPVSGPPSWWQKRKANFTLREAWVRPQVEAFLDRVRPDVAHVHDFPHLPLVLDCAEPRGIPVVADFHENMPAAKRAWRSHLSPYRRLKAAILFHYGLWQRHERLALQRCAKVIVVVPEAAERFRGYGLPEDFHVIVSNTEDETTFDFDGQRADPAILERYSGQWMVTYVGGIGPHRGWETTLAGVAAARGRIPGLRLTIVGATAENEAMLRARAESLGIADLVDIIGWQPFHAVNSYILASRVCLVPHNDFEHTHTTVPHKLFQYMICERPVLVSDCRPLRRIAEETDGCFVFRAGDAEDFADRLVEIHADPALAAQRARRGREAALGPYAWRHDAARLLALYAELGRRAA